MEYEVGDRVIYRGTGMPEYGVVIHAWENHNGDQNCWVAFFGHSFPTDEPIIRPYMRRYYAASLEKAP